MKNAVLAPLETNKTPKPVESKSRQKKVKSKYTTVLESIAHGLDRIGFGFFAPFLLLAAWSDPNKQIKDICWNIGLPFIAFAIFVSFWVFCADKVKTDSWKIPSPTETFNAAIGIHNFALSEKSKEKEFHLRMEKISDKWQQKSELALSKGDIENAEKYKQKADDYLVKNYAGPPTYYDQIATSLLTVGIGFLMAIFIAVPLGILCGLSPKVNTALNGLIQIFKPVSPLAWLPIVFVFVTVLYDPPDGPTLFGREIFISAGTVTLCSLWPTLMNTALGVSSINKDYLNVAKVLNLKWHQRIFKIVLPASLPLMFTGMRLSLGVGWMVLIAADMLAQNPGLGKFVWDTFQNGSTESMSQIVVAVFTVGIIGFFLDRIMFILQKSISYSEESPA